MSGYMHIACSIFVWKRCQECFNQSQARAAILELESLQRHFSRTCRLTFMASLAISNDVVLENENIKCLPQSEAGAAMLDVESLGFPSPTKLTATT